MLLLLPTMAFFCFNESESRWTLSNAYAGDWHGYFWQHTKTARGPYLWKCLLLSTYLLREQRSLLSLKSNWLVPVLMMSHSGLKTCFMLESQNRSTNENSAGEEWIPVWCSALVTGICRRVSLELKLSPVCCQYLLLLATVDETLSYHCIKFLLWASIEVWVSAMPWSKEHLSCLSYV